jgi:hypothetical protein
MGLRIPYGYAQQDRPRPSTIAKDALRDSPAPPAVSSSVERTDEQPAAGESRSDKGADGGQQVLPSASVDASSCGISGTVMNVSGDVVPGASVVLEGPQPGDRQAAVASDTGAFQFDGLKAGIPYQVTIGIEGLETWKSPTVTLEPWQHFLMPEIKLNVSRLVTSIEVHASQDQIATEQVEVAEKQRVFGIIPNFYVTYDRHPVPLTTKLKFRLAFKSDTDPITFVGVAFVSAIYQAGDILHYGQGWDAYGKRVGAGYADTSSDIFLGGAILPWLLHQDPRYFYQGTGTKKSRAIHAISSPFICRGDNGKTQVNFSSIGGDLGSGAISNLYYPQSDRGAGLVFSGFAITTGVRVVNAVLQEFVLRKLSPSARTKH